MIKLAWIFVFFTSIKIHSQIVDSSIVKNNNSFGFRIIPSVKDNIYGVAIGLVGSETICNVKNTKKSHGLNIQLIGQGLFILLNPNSFKYKNIMKISNAQNLFSESTMNFKSLHNGLLISTFGTFTDVSNGIVFSGLSSLGYLLNGFAFNLICAKYIQLKGVSISISNESYSVKGLQIGLINRTSKIKGLQFGLWNVNENRKLPFFNWGLDKESKY